LYLILLNSRLLIETSHKNEESQDNYWLASGIMLLLTPFIVGTVLSSLDIFLFALGVTLPIFIVLSLGTVLMRIGSINSAFVTSASKLSFNVALPALLFTSITEAEIDFGRNFSLVIYGIVATAVVYILLELLVPRFVSNRADRGVVIQGSFRSNMGIIGFAYCINAYGNEAYATAAIYLAIVTIFYNVFAVITLTRWISGSDDDTSTLLKKVAIGVFKNPIVLSIIFAISIKAFAVPLPPTFSKAISYLSQMALPLALLCAGASLSFKLNSDLKLALIATVLRLVVLPTAITFGGYMYGFKGVDLGILFMMASAPAAAASYTMVRAMNGNSTLAANIIALTTIFSLLSTGLGAALLRALDLV